jgi:hypothetical protein
MNSITKHFLLNFFKNQNDLEVFRREDIRFIENILLHKEEKEIKARDTWGNWDFPYTDYDYNKPYLDEYILDKINQNGIIKRNIWPNGKKMAVCFSHDVDVVSKHDIEYPIRQFRSKTKNLKNLFALSYQLAKQKNIFRHPKQIFVDWRLNNSRSNRV